MRPPRSVLAAGAAVLALTLGACTGGSEGSQERPEDVLAAAKAQLDETSGVRVLLETEQLPPKVEGIVRAEGVGNHTPAFKGELKVAAGGVQFDVPVVAAEGKVLAKLPFTTDFVEVNPSEYSAPDPAALMAAEGGLSSLLTAATDVEQGQEVRSGEDVLASYTGVLPGESVVAIIPGADAESDFEATFTIDDEDHLREAVLTGQFYPDTEEMTYTVTFEEYDTAADITLP